MTTNDARETVRERSLTGIWEFRVTDGDGPVDEWLEGSIPGDVYSDLLAVGRIEDPYVDDNELDVQWVGETDWTYRRTVEVDEATLAHDRVRLEFDGLDTVAEVYVNGTLVGESENMYRGYAFDVGDALDPGENEVRVEFRSPVEYGVEQQEAYPYEVPALRYPVDQPARNFVRKPGCHYGWDWGPCLPGVGIWRDVRLVASSAPRLEYVTTEQRHHEGGSVTLSVRAGVDAPDATVAELTASVAGDEGTVAATTEAIDLHAGKTDVETDLRVEDPDLWWPNGYGDQPLYGLDVEIAPIGHADTTAAGDADATVDGKVGDDERDADATAAADANRDDRDADVSHALHQRIGFREFELVREDDDVGESFQFVVNGEPVYSKGANWIPIDQLQSRVTRDRYRDLLGNAAAANMNTIRVWGGGYYEHDAFYELCDELGLLVWQDFMFSCALYPGDDDFLDTVEAEARYQTRRLSTHPSLALWCGNNENEMSIVNWFDDHPNIDEFTEDYERLNARIAEVVAEEDPERTFWPASPSSGGDLDPHDQTRGDVHYWNVWHEGEPFSDYLDVEPRFVSEFGYQSFASADLLAEYLPADQLNPTAPLMEHHQRHPRGNRLILRQIADTFRFPFEFEDFVELSQVQQALAMKTAIEHWRRRKPTCTGTLYWQLNDLWPCASWSSIEYGGDWKALQHVARRFYEPVLVSTAVRDADDEPVGPDESGEAPCTVEVWLTSDRPGAVEGTVEIDAYALDGEHVLEETVEATLDPHESRQVTTVDEAEIDAEPDDLLVRVAFEGSEYPNYQFLEPYKRLDLPDPGLDATVDSSEVVLDTEGAALFVALSAPELDGRFEDNYVHLAPGERRRIAFEGDADGDELRDALEVTHLRETY